MKKTCSLVITDRNDGEHAYKDIERLKFSINSAIENYDEIWFIDWNSEGRPLLHNIYNCFPHKGNIRNIIITETIAKTIVKNQDQHVKIPQSIPTNIGIRRSTTDYIVTSGIDIFGPSPNNFIKLINSLKEDTFYTLSRRELPRQDLYENFKYVDWKRALEYFENIIPERHLHGQCSPGDWFSIINCCGDYQIAHRDIWNKIRGFEEKMCFRCFNDTNVQKKAVMNRFKIDALYSPAIFHISHDEHHYEFKRNNPIYWVDDFRKTENTENWGLANIDFDVEVI